MYNLKIEKTEKGNLRLSLPDLEDREDLLDRIARNERLDVVMWHDLLERFSCNGSYTPINAEAHAIGLTSDPYLLAEVATLEDDGSLTVTGGMWHYNDYMLKSAVAELALGREILLHKFHDTNGKPETIPAFK